MANSIKVYYSLSINIAIMFTCKVDSFYDCLMQGACLPTHKTSAFFLNVSQTDPKHQEMNIDQHLLVR